MSTSFLAESGASPLLHFFTKAQGKAEQLAEDGGLALVACQLGPDGFGVRD
jgi:hypothetical protein